MVSFVYILFFVVVSSLLGLTGGVLLLLNKRLAYKISKYMMSFAAGALIGVAFLDLLPEAVVKIGFESASIFTLAGLVIFLIIEIALWHHHHAYGKETHSFSSLVILGDTLHNFIDGIILAVTFLVSAPLGIATFIAVILHEIPQEIGDFSVLLYAKMKRIRIVFYNILSALISVLGAALAYFVLQQSTSLIYFLVAFVAGGFIYISAADLIPETRKETKFKKSLVNILLLLLGITVIWYVGFVFSE